MKNKACSCGRANVSAFQKVCYLCLLEAHTKEMEAINETLKSIIGKRFKMNYPPNTVFLVVGPSKSPKKGIDGFTLQSEDGKEGFVFKDQILSMFEAKTLEEVYPAR